MPKNVSIHLSSVMPDPHMKNGSEKHAIFYILSAKKLSFYSFFHSSGFNELFTNLSFQSKIKIKKKERAESVRTPSMFEWLAPFSFWNTHSMIAYCINIQENHIFLSIGNISTYTYDIHHTHMHEDKNIYSVNSLNVVVLFKENC